MARHHPKRLVLLLLALSGAASQSEGACSGEAANAQGTCGSALLQSKQRLAKLSEQGVESRMHAGAPAFASFAKALAAKSQEDHEIAEKVRSLKPGGGGGGGGGDGIGKGGPSGKCLCGKDEFKGDKSMMQIQNKTCSELLPYACSPAAGKAKAFFEMACCKVDPKCLCQDKKFHAHRELPTDSAPVSCGAVLPWACSKKTKVPEEAKEFLHGFCCGAGKGCGKLCDGGAVLKGKRVTDPEDGVSHSCEDASQWWAHMADKDTCEEKETKTYIQAACCEPSGYGYGSGAEGSDDD